MIPSYRTIATTTLRIKKSCTIEIYHIYIYISYTSLHVVHYISSTWRIKGSGSSSMIEEGRRISHKSKELLTVDAIAYKQWDVGCFAIAEKLSGCVEPLLNRGIK